MQPQLALELADPGRRRRCRRAAGGHSAAMAASGSTSSSRRSASIAVSRRSVASASSSSARCGPLAQLGQAASRRRPARGAGRRARADSGPRPRRLWRRRCSRSVGERGLDRRPGGRRRRRRAGRAATSAASSSTRRLLGRGARASAGRPGAPRPRPAGARGTARRSSRPAGARPRGRCGGRRPRPARSSSRLPGLGHRARPRSALGLSSASSVGQQRPRARRRGPRSRATALGELARCVGQQRQLGLGVASAARARRARPPRRRPQRAVVARRGGGQRRPRRRGPRRARPGPRRRGPRPRAPAPRPRLGPALGPRRARRRWRRCRRRRPRQPVSPKRSPPRGDDDGVGVGEGGVDRGGPVAVDGDGRGRAARRAGGSTSGRRGPDVAAHRLADRRRRARGRCGAERQHRAGQRRRRRSAASARRPASTDVDHDGGQRLAGARPRTAASQPGVDLDEVEQRAEHAVDARPGARRRPATGPRRAPAASASARAVHAWRSASAASPGGARRPPRRCLGRPRGADSGARRRPRRAAASALGAPARSASALGGLGGERDRASRAAAAVRRSPRSASVVGPGQRLAHGGQLAADLGGRADRRGRRLGVGPAPLDARARSCLGEGRLVGGQGLGLRLEAPRPRPPTAASSARSRAARPRGWRSRPGRPTAAALALDAAAPLGEQRRADPGPARAATRRGPARRRRRSPPRADSSASVAMTAVSSSASRRRELRSARRAARPGPRRRRSRRRRSVVELAPGDEHAQRGQLGRPGRRGGGPPRPGAPAGAAGGGPRAAGPAGGSGWPRWRSRRRSDFSLRLRYFRTPAASSMISRRSSGRALSTASIWPWLMITCCWRPTPASREQLLDVEQPARHAVDGVLAVAGAEQRAGDRDLAELDRQQAGAVVDGERRPRPGRAPGAWACRRR